MNDNSDNEIPKGIRGGRAIRAILNAMGAIPFVGGVLAAGSAAWSEQEQETINSFFEHSRKMLEAELAEKAQTILEIMARLDMKTRRPQSASRVLNTSLWCVRLCGIGLVQRVKKKREFIRNILANAAVTQITSDDVVRLFLQWLSMCSELHFTVIAAFTTTRGLPVRGYGRKLGRKRFEKILLKPICSSC